MSEDNGECEGRDRHGGDGEQLDSDQRRERVVDDAVGDEAVPPRVPEVVPEREAVLEEGGALVGVGCEVGARRPEPDEQRCQKGGGRCAENGFARKRGGADGHCPAR